MFPIRPVYQGLFVLSARISRTSTYFHLLSLTPGLQGYKFQRNAFLRALFFSWNNSEGVCSNNGWHFEVSSQISPSWGHSSIYRGSIIAFISGYCSLLYPALLCGPNNLLFLITKAMLTYQILHFIIILKKYEELLVLRYTFGQTAPKSHFNSRRVHHMSGGSVYCCVIALYFFCLVIISPTFAGIFYFHYLQ